jgi:hypothetical protein
MAMKSKYRTFFSILIGILIGCSVSFGQTLIQGTVAISSTGIIDYSGRNSFEAELPRLVGWTFKGMNWQLEPQSWESEGVIENIRQYGVNTIRRHFASAPLMEEGAATRATYFSRWHNVANWCANSGMWVIFDFYTRDLGGNQGTYGMKWVWEMPETDFLELWRVIAREMKDHGNVLLELGNEPNDYGMDYPEHRDIWMQRCIKAIEVIRQEGFQGYIVIPLPEVATWAPPALAYRNQIVDADPLGRFMWDFHYYWYHQEYQVGTPDDYSLSDVQGWLDQKSISDLRALGDRVLCGEFGVHGQDYDARDMQWFQNLLTILKRDGYDMICEAYQPGTDFPQLSGDWGTTDWQTLNAQGNVYVDALPIDMSYYE